MADRFFLKQGTNYCCKLPVREEDPIVLLSGPPSSGKTSLLFQFAFNSAAEGNGAVVILCNKRRLERNPPFLSQGVDPSSEVFRRIRMKYVDDDEGIKNYFAAFHLHDEMPQLVIVDDFVQLHDDKKCQERHNNPRRRDMSMARVLALCRDAIDHANKRGPCQILLSDTHKGDSPRLLYIFKRWVSSIYTIIKGAEEFGSYILSRQYPEDDDVNMGSAKYSIALQYLALEGKAKASGSV
ncbi:hypothetical protein M569_06533 [Genlisea aurea]|uniref:Uncharacterized protein n=1 Tax=Genlisea aurea TaxID=192259 RepID=S8CM54_9LAMI|nr:hypothetical protein M569_06533 [Genlisea aurea]